jgi:hypothetical protein
MFEVVVTRYTDRYLTAMGITFLLLVLFAPNGITGAVDGLKRRFDRRRATASAPTTTAGRPGRGPR